VAQRSASAPQAVAELYRARGLSTDTAVEARLSRLSRSWRRQVARAGAPRAARPDRRPGTSTSRRGPDCSRPARRRAISPGPSSTR